jgi:uncharacterized membrane protein YhiD involved in acid resistance
MKDISAEEGLVAIGYERRNHQWRYGFRLLALVLIL